MSELINATTTKGRKASTVFGKGLDMKRGRITSNSRIIRGYRESGRTRVPPPMPPGNNGKLLKRIPVVPGAMQHLDAASQNRDDEFHCELSASGEIFTLGAEDV